MTTSTAIGASDIAEFIRGYERVGGWNGAQIIYDSNLREAEHYTALVAARPLAMPALAIDRQGSDFTAKSFAPAVPGKLKTQTIPDTGHYVAMEAPVALASAMLAFMSDVDQAR